MGVSALKFKAISEKYFAFILLAASAYCTAGPYPPAAGIAGSTAIAANDPSIAGWASSYLNYSVGIEVDAEWQKPELALGLAGNSNGNNLGHNFDIVSLGRGGQITLQFDNPIGNGNGYDFAVFENSFNDTFLELAWVEVSSNGIDFARFQTASLTPVSVGPFDDIMEASDIDGLAGKYRGGYGTPFDLSDLPATANVDINNINYIRIIDVIGDGSADDDLPNAQSPVPIYDPYPTFGSAGFDLEAVAVLNYALPEIEENVPLPPLALFFLAALLAFIARQKSINSTQ